MTILNGDGAPWRDPATGERLDGVTPAPDGPTARRLLREAIAVMPEWCSEEVHHDGTRRVACVLTNLTDDEYLWWTGLMRRYMTTRRLL